MIPPLTAAGLNGAAEKNLASTLNALAGALEPFKHMSTEQLTELLGLARHYRDNGTLPEPAGAKSKALRATAAKAPKLDPSEVVARLRDIQERAHQLEPSAIAREVDALKGMAVADLKTVQKVYLGAAVGKTKVEILASLRKKIDDYRNSRDRADGILAF